MRVLGLDPGLATTGFGLVQEKETGDLELMACGVITTPPDMSIAERLLSIDHKLGQLIAQYRPQAVAIEELFFCKNITTALVVGQARGVILVGIARAGLPVSEYKPLQIKQSIAGYGQASKKQVQEMVRMLLNLERVPQPDDAADAIAIAICHIHHQQFAGLVKE